MIEQSEVHEWVEWARMKVPLNDYPSLDCIVEQDDCPWNRAYLFSESPSELRNLFERELLADPSDLAVRFAVLSMSFILAKYTGDDPTGEDLKDPNLQIIAEGNSKIRKEFEQNYCYFLHMFKIDVCSEWPRLRWEIENGYIIRDWPFCDDIYAHAQRLGTPTEWETQVLGGQYRFLRVFGPGIEESYTRKTHKYFKTINQIIPWVAFDKLQLPSLFWPIRPLATKDFPEIMLLLWASIVEGQSRVESRGDLDLLEDVVRDLSKALRNEQEEKGLCPILVARSYFGLGQFHEAAKWYSSVLHNVPLNMARINEELYLTIARCYELAGDLPRATAVLYQCADEFPEKQGVYLRIAMFESSQSHFELVPECLRKEKERNPEFGDDWRESVILALSSIAPSEKGNESENLFFQARPDIAQGLDRTIRVFWPAFAKLSEPARRKWLFALYLSQFEAITAPSLILEASEGAVAWFAKAVELELKTRVFLPFRQFIQTSRRQLRVPIEEDGFVDRMADTAAKFLFRRPKLTLGEMAKILETCGSGSELIVITELNAWLKQNRCSDLIRLSEQLKRLAVMAGEAKHEVAASPKGQTDSSADTAREISRNVLNELCTTCARARQA